LHGRDLDAVGLRVVCSERPEQLGPVVSSGQLDHGGGQIIGPADVLL
jgi:hypothetical protein